MNLHRALPGRGSGRAIIAALCTLVCSLLLAADQPHIEVVGLFKDAAVIRIDDRQSLLRIGETSEEGVRLVSATSDEAVVQVAGELVTLTLSRMMGGEFKEPERSTISIAPNAAGQYMVGGVINGLPVTMLVDTGANVVAMSERHARALGIDYGDGERMDAATASGVAATWRVRIASVQIGAIEVNDVAAAVIEGDHPPVILLGMSFLERVELSNSGGILMLTSKL